MLLAIAEGSAAGVAQLDQLDSMQFYHLYRAWTDRQDRMAAAYAKAGKK